VVFNVAISDIEKFYQFIFLNRLALKQISNRPFLRKL